MTAKPTAKYLKDYQPSPFQIPTTDLYFNLDDENTLVRSHLRIERKNEQVTDLTLDADVKDISEVKIDGRSLDSSEYTIKEQQLIIFSVPSQFELEIECNIDPLNNKALEGLYKSSGVFCTQCEAEGFRKITPFLDRPDVLSVFTVTIFADKASYPYMLSNGNDIEHGELEEDGQTTHWVKWHDPFPKPSYLFALVAGDFDLLEDQYQTGSGRDVALQLFVDKGNLNLAHHAMTSLKKSMLWDEQTYGLEYDLEKYMIVAVDFFNMGAMENKGLNVFNSKYVMADERTATDTDYHGVEAVIAHEYFHNWTGNRVTCRDWFQLSLKEGLTVFRDQQFSADMGSEVLERISHANVMRTMQFAEDAGPMAHPIRPEKVIEMNNFYTVTVYDKGAEVIRMMHSLLGVEGFRRGMDLYFSRHDGQAVTCDDFVSAMADANNFDMSLFRNWYRQAGTPVVEVTETVSTDALEVILSQSIPTRPADETVQTLLIPVKFEVLDANTGESLERGVWEFNQVEQSFNLPYKQPVILVLFENFSAPVKVVRQQSTETLIKIAKYATDAFCRWDAIQQLWHHLIRTDLDGVSEFIELMRSILQQENMSSAIKAQLLAVPSFEALAEPMAVVDVDKILSNRDSIVKQIANALNQEITAALLPLQSIANGYEATLVGARSLKSVLLSLIAELANEQNNQLIQQTFLDAKNMTEKVAALNAMRQADTSAFSEMTRALADELKGNVLVLDKVLVSVAKVESDAVYQMMADWAKHPDFNSENPNRIRSLYGAFVMANPKMFHAEDGSGYRFLTELLKKIDQFNPQVASRMISPLLSYQRYDEHRKSLMLEQLKQLSEQKLSADLFEKVTAALQ